MNLKSLVITIAMVIFTVTKSSAWIRYKYRHRPECRDLWPRRSENLPPVVLTGVVESLYPPPSGSLIPSGSVYVKWIHKGLKTLEGTRITIDGLGQPDPCLETIRKSDTLIFLLEPVTDGLFRLNSTAIRVNLNNLDRIQSLISDKPWRRRSEIPDLPCEAHYCPFNGECFVSNGVPSCKCIDTCSHAYEPVCGSNGETFINECRLRADSCIRQLNIFTRYVGSCENRKNRMARSLASSYSYILKQAPHQVSFPVNKDQAIWLTTGQWSMHHVFK